jgi:3-hydroxyisobutyrate dehydrogenase-like beta-hydroxyacid dehydrogenase
VGEAARDLGVPIFAAELVEQLLRVLEAEGAGDQGTQQLVTVLERLAGATVQAPSGA